ncbi:MAG: pirin family protein [Legionella sp.]|nr:pirin family protein [Legionella sp.]
MKLLKYNDLPQGGFAGLRERRFVMDEKLFKHRKNPEAFNGIGRFVYLADANFMPHGETGMHNHREIDVISVMIDGCIKHAGSLEHGQELKAGSVQVQRAGSAGFSHNEINPDATENHMIQIWALPDASGEPAGYKFYDLVLGEQTLVYGGNKNQAETFDSKTCITVTKLKPNQIVEHQGECMAYIATGEGFVGEEKITPKTLIKTNNLVFKALNQVFLILIH